MRDTVSVSVCFSIRATGALLRGALGVASTVALAACDDPDVEPPVILDATFESQTVLRLQFSEPMAPMDDVAPTVFRLSAAFAQDGQTLYYDLGHHFDGSDPDGEAPTGAAAAIPLGPEGSLAAPLDLRPRHYFAEFVKLELDPGDPSVAHLTNFLEVDNLGACSALDEAPKAGLYLHYSSGFDPVTDEAGNLMQGMAGQWVRSLFFKTEYGEFPYLDPAASIPCPRGS